MSIPVRSIRLQRRSSDSLNTLSGASGEIFFDADLGALRLYTNNNNDRRILADRTWVRNNTFSGRYEDLENKPAIPTNTSSLVNDSGFITVEDVPDGVDISSLANIGDVILNDLQENDLLAWNGTAWTNSAVDQGLATVATTGDYNDLINAPVIENYATEEYVDNVVGNSINAVIANAPSDLNTLNELAAALGNDADFATTVANALDEKAPVDGPIFTGTTTLQQTVEVLNSRAGTTVFGTQTFNFATGAVWYLSSAADNFTANFTNVPTTNNRAISVVLLINQDGTPHLPTAVEIDGVAQTIKWQGADVPSATANQVDVVSFTLIRTDQNPESIPTWIVIGSVTTFG